MVKVVRVVDTLERGVETEGNNGMGGRGGACYIYFPEAEMVGSVTRYFAAGDVTRQEDRYIIHRYIER